MNITLVQPPFENYASKQPPLGLAYIAAVLKEKGAKVSIIDGNVEGKCIEDIFHKIKITKPEIIGLSITTPLVKSAFLIAKYIKENKKGIPIIAGGPHPTLFPEEMLNSGLIDFVVNGEGEETITDLYDYFNGTKKIIDVKGLSFIHNKKIIHTPKRPLISDLDKLPFPAWELFPLKKYKGTFRKTDFNLPVMTSRGCPFNCTFCYKGITGRTYRARSPKSVVKEIEYLKNKFKIKEFSITDDNFTLIPRRAIEICDLLIKRKIDLSWCPPNGIRVDRCSKELFLKMKEAGCYRIYMAVECGDQEILNIIGKGITLNQARNAFKMAKGTGMETTAFFMIGNLGETMETMNKSIDLAKEIDPDFVSFSIATPYPGTEMYNEVKRNGKLLIKNWEDLSTYNGAVFEYKNLTRELINSMHKKAVRSFYMRPKFIFRYLKNNFSIVGIKNLLKAGLIALKIIT